MQAAKLQQWDLRLQIEIGLRTAQSITWVLDQPHNAECQLELDQNVLKVSSSGLFVISLHRQRTIACLLHMPVDDIGASRCSRVE